MTRRESDLSLPNRKFGDGRHHHSYAPRRQSHDKFFLLLGREITKIISLQCSQAGITVHCQLERGTRDYKFEHFDIWNSPNSKMMLAQFVMRQPIDKYKGTQLQAFTDCSRSKSDKKPIDYIESRIHVLELFASQLELLSQRLGGRKFGKLLLDLKSETRVLSNYSLRGSLKPIQSTKIQNLKGIFGRCNPPCETNALSSNATYLRNSHTSESEAIVPTASNRPTAVASYSEAVRINIPAGTSSNQARAVGYDVVVKPQNTTLYSSSPVSTIDGSESLCKICYTRTATDNLFPCGHTTCTGCFYRLESRVCPFCRRPLTQTVNSSRDPSNLSYESHVYQHDYSNRYGTTYQTQRQSATTNHYGHSYPINNVHNSSYNPVPSRQPSRLWKFTKIGLSLGALYYLYRKYF